MPDLIAISDSLLKRARLDPGQAFEIAVEADVKPGDPAKGMRDKARETILNLGGMVQSDSPTLPDSNPFIFAKVSGAMLTELAEQQQDQTGISAIEEVDAHKRNLTNSLILEPLLSEIQDEPGKLFDVIIEINQEYKYGRDAAIQRLLKTFLPELEARPKRQPDATHPYVFARITGAAVQKLALRDQQQASAERDNEQEAIKKTAQQQAPAATLAISPLYPYLCIYKIWEDADIRPLINRTIATVKADAAQVAFSARGRDVVWAIMDSGIDGTHAHFSKNGNLQLPGSIKHRDFTTVNDAPEDALTDGFGHGTHVAGILAGETNETGLGRKAVVVTKIRNEDGSIGYQPVEVSSISGMAPECKLVSLKVLDNRGSGKVSGLIDAIESVQKINDYGRRVLIHGVNMSLGYEFDPEWFAAGQSPLCVEVNRLVKSGVCVVVAAGNTGYGFVRSADRVDPVAAGLPLSINDPGNAELAITVGSTHRYMPHTYGVSYFSSKGPTGDGRCKPDLVAPGEKIISCATGRSKAKLQASAGVARDFDFLEDSGTSMAAPHVSGVIAAFLSIRPEFRGEPEKVKSIFLAAATDLGRDRMFQGTGLVDLMRAIQSV